MPKAGTISVTGLIINSSTLGQQNHWPFSEQVMKCYMIFTPTICKGLLMGMGTTEGLPGLPPPLAIAQSGQLLQIS